MKLYSVKQSDDPKNINHVAIAIGKVVDDQLHTGFYYKKNTLETKFLHLGWHKDLKNGPPQDKYIWIEIPLGPLTLTNIAAYCELISETKPVIPYGFAIEDATFGTDGTFNQVNKYSGLTCASFVVLVLRAQGIEIIDFDNWPIKPEDKSWQLKALEWLNASIIKNDFIEHHKNTIEKGTPRFSPEEVAAAATSTKRPSTRNETQSQANEIVSFINKISSQF